LILLSRIGQSYTRLAGTGFGAAATPRSRKGRPVWISQSERASRAFKGRKIYSIDFTEVWIVEKIRLPGNYTVGSSIGIVLFGADGRICRRSPFRKTARTTIFPPVFHSTEQQPTFIGACRNRPGSTGGCLTRSQALPTREGAVLLAAGAPEWDI
jgi:hypothetical protein